MIADATVKLVTAGDIPNLLDVHAHAHAYSGYTKPVSPAVTRTRWADEARSCGWGERHVRALLRCVTDDDVITGVNEYCGWGVHGGEMLWAYWRKKPPRSRWWR
jgi:hypothetical protein